MVSQSDPQRLLLYLLRQGSCRLEQADRSCTLSAGDLAVHDTSLPSAFEATGGIDLLVVSFPKRAFGNAAQAISQASATTLGRSASALRGVAETVLLEVADLADRSSLSEPEASSLSRLLVGAIQALHDCADVEPSSPSHSALLLRRMRHYALAHLDDPALGPARLAAEHHYSTRYVHALFASEGEGVSEWIRRQRLERARAHLRLYPHDPVEMIARRFGYVSPASFSRAFRHAYGLSPSRYRRSLS